ncbi:MAG: BNR-4 repeat-containing protein [Verrucomicrobiota bacterium]
MAAGAYADFRNAHFSPDIERSAAIWSDPNRDGVPNLVEYALGRDPLGANPGPPWLVTVENEAAGGRALMLRYSRDASAQVELNAEWTADLASGDWSTDGLRLSTPLVEGGPHSAAITLDDADAKAFLRLRATLPRAVADTQGAGYRGIWYTLGQYSTYGDKYSGGLGTYTSSHTPMAIYVPEVNKTFFTYGGTPSEERRQLQIMIGAYDHSTGLVCRPTLVYSRNFVDDPHDNASLSLDEEGHIWLFVSGRNTTREARFFRSDSPFSIESFQDMGSTVATYPQPHWFEGRGFLHLFTKYTAGRELYWSTSRNGDNWGSDQKLAGIGGHYQVSARHGDRVGTAFNRHPGGNVDRRTDLYYLQTDDRGTSWHTASGAGVATPLTAAANPALVRDYASENRLVYVQDMAFDAAGRPAILYLTSGHHQPGPDGGPRTWGIAHWQGTHWVSRQVATSTHNYDVGFLRIEDDGVWRVIGPTGTGPQPWGTGGEIELWESTDDGATWAKTRILTAGSARNHGYVRHPVNAHPDFYAFWADGDTDALSRSHLYFANREGDRVHRLPYTMSADFAEPELMPAIP